MKGIDQLVLKIKKLLPFVNTMETRKSQPQVGREHLQHTYLGEALLSAHSKGHQKMRACRRPSGLRLMWRWHRWGGLDNIHSLPTGLESGRQRSGASRSGSGRRMSSWLTGDMASSTLTSQVQRELLSFPPYKVTNPAWSPHSRPHPVPEAPLQTLSHWDLGFSMRIWGWGTNTQSIAT